jgi:hypothetical protein
MYIYKLTIRNFASFNGLHAFDFGEGLNLVVSPSRAGKINLLRALKLAWVGNASIEDQVEPLHLFSYQSRERTPEPYFGIKAEVISEYGVGKCFFNSRIEGQRLISRHLIPVELLHKFPDFPSNVFMQGRDCRGHLLEQILCKTRESINDNCCTIILGQVWNRLSDSEQFTLLQEVETSEIDQVIMLEDELPRNFSEISDDISHIVELEKTENCAFKNAEDDQEGFR